MSVVLDLVSNSFAFLEPLPFDCLATVVDSNGDKMLRSIDSRLLVSHPRVMDRLREEINFVLAGKAELNREDLKKMTYLSNILKESMLIHAHVFPRTSLHGKRG